MTNAITIFTHAVCTGLAQTDEPEMKLTIGGIIIMSVSIGMVLALLSFCLYKILREPSEQ